MPTSNLPPYDLSVTAFGDGRQAAAWAVPFTSLRSSARENHISHSLAAREAADVGGQNTVHAIASLALRNFIG